MTDAAPTNVSCLKPAVTQFPNPIIKKDARQHGLVILHILVAVYMFIGLAIVCDDFFVPSLTRVSDGELTPILILLDAREGAFEACPPRWI